MYRCYLGVVEFVRVGNNDCEGIHNPGATLLSGAGKPRRNRTRIERVKRCWSYWGTAVENDCWAGRRPAHGFDAAEEIETGRKRLDADRVVMITRIADADRVFGRFARTVLSCVARDRSNVHRVQCGTARF